MKHIWCYKNHPFGVFKLPHFHVLMKIVHDVMNSEMSFAATGGIIKEKSIKKSILLMR